jgi:hypothetical protein
MVNFYEFAMAQELLTAVAPPVAPPVAQPNVAASKSP